MGRCVIDRKFKFFIYRGSSFLSAPALSLEPPKAFPKPSQSLPKPPKASPKPPQSLPQASFWTLGDPFGDPKSTFGLPKMIS